MNQQQALNRSQFEVQDLSADYESGKAYFPAFIAVAGSIAMALIRLNVNGEHFITDEALMILALAAYLIAVVFLLTGLYAPFRFAEHAGKWAATLGVLFNLSSWLVRWVAAYDRELAIFNDQGLPSSQMPWVFRYVPFANLYDLSLAFAFGAGITTLIIMSKRFQSVAALSLLMATMVLILACFIGGEFIDLPPVLDSYWRPIHVGIASLSYGVALVCFAVAVLYLIKDGLQVEKIAVCTCLFGVAVFGSISKFSVFAIDSLGSYRASIMNGSSRTALALRADIPYAGWMMVIAAALLIAAAMLFASYVSGADRVYRRWGIRSLSAALIAQAVCIVTLIYQIRTVGSVISMIDPSQFRTFAVWMLQQQGSTVDQVSAIGQQQLYDIGNTWVTENASHLYLSLKANPVELAALITAFIATLFVLTLTIDTEKIRSTLPELERLDALMYKLAGVAFAGLALLLMTGAIWANESWGRYWGWDSKEVGALVAWLAYAGFLHSRIAYGWRGRRSAYFAVAAFLFIIFTYLGVSYLLPGLHSYA